MNYSFHSDYNNFFRASLEDNFVEWSVQIRSLIPEDPEKTKKCDCVGKEKRKSHSERRKVVSSVISRSRAHSEKSNSRQKRSGSISILGWEGYSSQSVIEPQGLPTYKKLVNPIHSYPRHGNLSDAFRDSARQ